MKVVGVIPARLGSTRIPRKMLVDINGRPLIQHTWEHLAGQSALDELVIATDSREILDVVEDFGGKVIMTSSDNKTGTDRVAEAVAGMDCDIAVNIQGDEIAMPPEVISLVIRVLAEDEHAAMGTAARPIVSEQEYRDRGVVKVVVDRDMNALYFSRAPLPHSKSGAMQDGTPYYHHIGIYSYRKEFLLMYPKLRRSLLEETESLEQLRAIENGYRIKVGVTDKVTVKIDTEEDLEKAREGRC
jgi:3-deoxy-manno-octulosonate cytidylyltransferase (CMP-KDO synthetase)